MVMTITSGDGCCTSMFPPPVWVQPDRIGVTLPLREPSDSDTSRAGVAVVTVMFSGCPGCAFGGCAAASAGRSPVTASPNTARRCIRLICVSLCAWVRSPLEPPDRVNRRGELELVAQVVERPGVRAVVEADFGPNLQVPH